MQKILFKESSKLGYEQFREVLLLLLAGALTDTNAEDPINPLAEEDLIRFDNSSVINQKETVYTNDHKNLNEQNLAPIQGRNPIETSQSMAFGSKIASDSMLIDFESQSKNNHPRESSVSHSMEIPWAPSPISPIKKYGRRSTPDEDLLRNREKLVAFFFKKDFDVKTLWRIKKSRKVQVTFYFFVIRIHSKGSF